MVGGAALWLVYGLIISDTPLIVRKADGVLLIGMIVIFKLRYG